MVSLDDRLPKLALAAVLMVSCTKILGLDYEYRLNGDETTTSSFTISGSTGGTGGAGGQGTTSGSTTTTATGGTGGCGNFVWDPLIGCQSCMQAKCCTELAGCDEGTPCGLLVACARSCPEGDDACKGDCLKEDEQNHASLGQNAYFALFECNYLKCRTDDACVFPICTSGFTTGERACSECVGDDPTCCNAVKTCSQNATCLDCLEDPEAPGCASNGPFHAIETCQFETCGKQCAYQLCENPDFGYYQSSCNDCINQEQTGCCAQFNECIEDTTSVCYKCMSGLEFEACPNDNKWNAYDTCVYNQCHVQCSGI